VSLADFHFTTAKNARAHSHDYKSHSQATLITSDQTNSCDQTATLDHASGHKQNYHNIISAASSNGILTMSSDSTKAVSDDIVNTSNETTTTTSADKGDTFPPNSIVAMSSTEAIATSPEEVTTTHASAITTSVKRKLASPETQEESQQRPMKKGRAIRDFEFIRDTFGYTFKNLDLLDEALDTTGLYRPQSNQSLALIGDSILQLTIYRDWYPSRQLKGM